MTVQFELTEVRAKLEALSQVDIAAMVATLDTIIAQLTTIRTDLSALSMANTADMLVHVTNAEQQLAAFEDAKELTLGIP
jgi:hypothetical protein